MIEILQTMEASHGMNVIMGLVVIVFALIMWNIQRDQNNKVDIKDLVCTNGELDEKKFMRFTAFVVSTWGFVYLIVDQRFSEWYFTGYMAMWAGNALLDKWISSKEPKDPPPPNNN
jgi:hypothetical protein